MASIQKGHGGAGGVGRVTDGLGSDAVGSASPGGVGMASDPSKGMPGVGGGRSVGRLGRPTGSVGVGSARVGTAGPGKPVGMGGGRTAGKLTDGLGRLGVGSASATVGKLQLKVDHAHFPVTRDVPVAPGT
jgi:hypothetical protein